MEQSIQTFSDFIRSRTREIDNDFIDDFAMSYKFRDEWFSDEVVCKWLGYRKDNLVRALDEYKEGQDFKISLLTTEERSHAKGGENKMSYSIHSKCFKRLAMERKNELGKKVRGYYIKLEELAFEYLDYLNGTKDTQVKQLEQENKVLKDQLKKGCVYMLFDKQNKTPLYIGQSINGIEKRFKDHIREIQHLIDSYDMKYIKLAAILGKDFRNRLDKKLIADQIPDGQVLNDVEQVIIHHFKDTLVNSVKSNDIPQLDIRPYLVENIFEEDEKEEDVYIEEETILRTTTIKEEIKKKRVFCLKCHKPITLNKDGEIRKHKCE